MEQKEIVISSYPVQIIYKKYPYKTTNYLIRVENMDNLILLSLDYSSLLSSYFELRDCLIQYIFAGKLDKIPVSIQVKIKFIVEMFKDFKNNLRITKDYLVQSICQNNPKIIFNIYSDKIIYDKYWKKFFLCSKIKNLDFHKNKIEKLFRDISNFVFGIELSFNVLIPQIYKVEPQILQQINGNLQLNDVFNII